MSSQALFDPDAPTVRASDPPTSSQTPFQLARNRRCSLVLVALHNAGPCRGATCSEVVEMIGGDRGAVARRLTDLFNAGLVYRAGTRPGAAGRLQAVHILTVAGVQAVPDARALLADSVDARLVPEATRVAAQLRAVDRLQAALAHLAEVEARHHHNLDDAAGDRLSALEAVAQAARSVA